MTIDVAEMLDGTWIVIELGNGCVSGPATNQNTMSHWRDLLIYLKN